MSSEKNYLNNSYKSFFEDSLSIKDPQLYKAIQDELLRQQQHVELIASENIVSHAVLEAQGSVLTNKYAEGYPGKRYYNGCEHVDVAENLAIERLKELFNCKFANAQPHSGAQANGAVFLALLNPGDTFMGMSLNSGGHITHGLKISMSGKWFNAIGYDVDKDSELIDYDNVEKLALEHKPKLIIAGGSAYSRVIDFKRFRDIANKIGAYLMVDMAHFSGLVAGKGYPNPCETLKNNGFKIYSDGTDTHLMLVDLRPYNVKGNLAAESLSRANITCNKNGIPFDTEKPTITSGIRLGTQAATTRGFGLNEFKTVGELITKTLKGLSDNPSDNSKIENEVKNEVIALTSSFPIYKNL
jgi:glycine/serine hydroxymethyltransferase